MVERNPSPPREFDDEAELFRQDMIGNTTISKKWVYTTLLDMCKEAEKHSEKKDLDDVDISDELQDEACRLWDLCIEEDLAKFFIDMNATKYFHRILSGSHSSRLTEIVVGILGNLACVSEACKDITNSTDLMTSIVSLLSCRDSHTLCEVGRLLITCLSDENSKDLWLDLLELALPEYIDDLVFIFNSSTNELVLKNLLEVIDICLDTRPGFLTICIKTDFTNALAEAGLQLANDVDSSAGVGYCLHSLYTLTTEENTAAASFKVNTTIFKFVSKCLERWKSMEDFTIKQDPSAVSVASCLTVLNFILLNSITTVKLDISDNITLYERTCICDIAQIINKCYKDELKKSEAQNDETKDHTDILNNSPKQLSSNEQHETNGDMKNDSPKCANDNKEHSVSNTLLFDGVPLYDTLNDLNDTLKKIGWK